MIRFDWETAYNGNLKWLPERTIYVTLHGSHAYGTSTPESDTDYRGIAVAPKDYYYGFLNTFEQSVQTAPVDLTVFEIRRFFVLASDANPNVLELLYTDPSDHQVVTPTMEKLFAIRDKFLSKKAKHTFSGYATQQMKRINTHYKWLKNPPTAPPQRSEFGLPERTVIPADQLAAAQSAIQKKLDSWSVDFIDTLPPDVRIAVTAKMTDHLAEVETAMNSKAWVGSARSLGYNENFIELLDKERRYNAKHREWSQYQDWKKNRNPDRAVLEERFGFDTKHASHLVRLLRMCREILTTGRVIVKRPDAEELRAIRAGAWTYEDLVVWAAAQDRELEEIAKSKECTLPKEPNRVLLDRLCYEIVESHLT